MYSQQQVTWGSRQSSLLLSVVWIILRPVPCNIFCSCPSNSCVYIITFPECIDASLLFSFCAVIQGFFFLASRYLPSLLMMDWTCLLMQAGMNIIRINGERNAIRTKTICQQPGVFPVMPSWCAFMKAISDFSHFSHSTYHSHTTSSTTHIHSTHTHTQIHKHSESGLVLVWLYNDKVPTGKV